MNREERRLVFEDTERLCRENKILADAIKKSNKEQELILETEDCQVDSQHRF